jgi:addiction module HigA family antidote
MGHSDRGALQTHDDERNMTTTELLEEIHPGEVLLKDFMQTMGITARQLAADIDVPPSRISGIVNARRPITAETAVRLGLFFGMDARFWVNLQAEYDMRLACRSLQQGGGLRIRPHQPRSTTRF